MAGRSNALTHVLTQTAVYWGTPATTGSGGRTFASPVELSVRWEQRHDLFVDSTGAEVRSNAVVYTGQDVAINGYLFLGDLDDLSSAEESDPTTLSDAYEIRGFESVPNIKGDRFARKAFL